MVNNQLDTLQMKFIDNAGLRGINSQFLLNTGPLNMNLSLRESP